MNNRVLNLIVRAQNKDREALNDLGHYYFSASIEQNYQKAFDYFQRAAELNYPNAQFNLGIMCHQGEGMEQNDNLAIEILTEAAELGSESALHYRQRLL